MFGFKRRTKLGRLKVQLSDSAQGTRSPAITHAKRISNSKQGEGISTSVNNRSSESSNESTSTAPEPNSSSSGSSENWMVLSIAGDKPTPRFNHAATVIGNKMIVVGGESANGMLEDVQVLNFDRFSWTTASSKLYLSPTSLPLKIPACKGHTLVSWGKKVLLVGGKTDPASDKITVWAFDTETECWSLMEAKGDIPAARSGHTVVKASSVLILFGGEDSKRRKLNDLHMFDLKSSTWLPLNCTGSGPSPRCNHVATLYDDKVLLVFGGTSKSRSLNDLYSLDFEAMVWSRIKIRGVHPSARAGCCGVLCGTKWYIAGGGSRKKRHAETLTYDIVKQEWSVAVASPPSSITTNKGFSLVLVQHKERDFLVAFGGTKKEISNQVEVLIMEKNEFPPIAGRVANSKLPGTLVFENRSSSVGLASQVHGAFVGSINAAGKQNLASAIEHHGSGRRSLSESLLVDGNNGSSAGNVSLRKKFHGNEDNNMIAKMAKGSEDGSPSQVLEQRAKQVDAAVPTDCAGGECTAEEASSASESDSFNTQNKDENDNLQPNSDDVVVLLETTDGTKSGVSASASITRLYETKIASLVKKNGMLEAQLAAALASREAAEKNLSAVLKSRQEMEKKLADAGKEMEMLKEKLAEIEVAQEEANSLSNIVHSDNVRLEHDVAFLKAVLDDTQKELHSTRGVLAGEGARALQLQVEVLHLKQRLQSMENRAPTPRKPFHG